MRQSHIQYYFLIKRWWTIELISKQREIFFSPLLRLKLQMLSEGRNLRIIDSYWKRVALEFWIACLWSFLIERNRKKISPPQKAQFLWKQFYFRILLWTFFTMFFNLLLDFFVFNTRIPFSRQLFCSSSMVLFTVDSR